MATKKPNQSWSGGRLWETIPGITTIHGEQIPASKTDVTPWDPGNQPKGFAWYGDAKGKGRWGIDPTSDFWGAKDKEAFSWADKAQLQRANQSSSKIAQIKASLPGWFGFSGYDEKTGVVRGYSRPSGFTGTISQGGSDTAEHYGQAGSWTFDTGSNPWHVAWTHAPDWYKAAKAKEKESPPPPTPRSYFNTSPEYQKNLADQKARMRQEKVEKIANTTQEEVKRSLLSDLYNWDLQYGQEDIAGGKHFTQDIKGEQQAASKQAQLRQQKQGVVRGDLETEQQNKGMTLAQRFNPQLTSDAVRAGMKGTFPLRSIRGSGLGGELTLGYHGTSKEAAESILKGGFREGSKSNIYGEAGTFLARGKGTNIPEAALDFSTRGGAPGRGMLDRAATIFSGNKATGGTPGGMIPAAFSEGAVSKSMNIPGTRYNEALLSSQQATKGKNLYQSAVQKAGKSAKARQLLQTGGTTAKIGAAKGLAKGAGRAVPILGAGLSLADAGYRATQGDIAGAGLSVLSAVPGAIGWGAMGAQAVYDKARSDPEFFKTKSVRGRSGANKAMKGKSLGRVDGRNVYSIPSFN